MAIAPTDTLIELSPPEHGYCQSCQQPAKVGGLKLAGWPHKLWICAACLQKLAAIIEKG